MKKRTLLGPNSDKIFIDNLTLKVYSIIFLFCVQAFEGSSSILPAISSWVEGTNMASCCEQAASPAGGWAGRGLCPGPVAPSLLLPGYTLLHPQAWKNVIWELPKDCCLYYVIMHHKKPRRTQIPNTNPQTDLTKASPVTFPGLLWNEGEFYSVTFILILMRNTKPDFHCRSILSALTLSLVPCFKCHTLHLRRGACLWCYGHCYNKAGSTKIRKIIPQNFAEPFYGFCLK